MSNTSLPQTIPGLQFPSVRHLIPPQVDDVLRNTYDNLVWLRAKILSVPQTAAIKPTIKVASPKPLPNTQILVDTHLVRTTTYTSVLPSIGVTFYEIDRNAFYIVAQDLASIINWTLLVAVMTAPLASRPADLAVRDTGFIFIDSSTHVFYVWTGTAWFALRAEAIVPQGLY